MRKKVENTENTWNMFQLCIALYFAQEFVKNCGRSGILPCKLKHKLACYCSLDAGRRHKTCGSETKDFIIHDSKQHEYHVGFSSDPHVLHWQHRGV